LDLHLKSKPRLWAVFVFFSIFLAGLAVASSADQPAQPPGSVAEKPDASSVEILSDTRHVDFRNYLAGLVPTIRKNWYALMPKSAGPPDRQKGEVAIQLVILPDGKIRDMKLASSSGNPALDRAAWGSVKASVPLPRLPQQFDGPYLALRIHFLYNPQKR
jgi:TonB family protein